MNANCSTCSSTFDESVHLSDEDIAFDVMHSSANDETVSLNCENAVTDPLSHLFATDRLSTSTECTDSSNGCMNQSDVIIHDYFRNEDAFELFQINTPQLSSQIETTTNGFAFLDERACPVNLSEHDDAIANNDVYLSNNRSCCALHLTSNTNRNTLHNNVLISSTTDVTRDDRCIIESWDASIEYFCDPNQITDFYSLLGEYQELSPPLTPNTLCTSNNGLLSSGCATNDFGSMTNLSDVESVPSSSILGPLSDPGPIISYDAGVYKSADSHYTQKRLNCALDHNGSCSDFRSDCSYAERCEDRLATNSIGKPPTCQAVIRAYPASSDDCDTSTNDFSSAIPHHTCQMTHAACGADNDLVKSDFAADKHVNEALDLLLSIMESN